MCRIKAVAVIFWVLLIISVVTPCFAEDEVLFHTDFENEVINEAPVSVFAFGTNSATTDDIIIKEQDGFKCADLLRSKYLTAIFSRAVSSGTFIVEFDEWQASGGPLISNFLYDDSYFISVADGASMRYMVFTAGMKIQTVLTTGISGAIDITDIDGASVKYALKRWNHLKFVVNIDEKTITLFLNDIECTKVSGYSYLGAGSIKGINFYNSGGVGAERFIDNLKIYIPDNTPGLCFTDYDGKNDYESTAVNPLLEKIELKFPYSLPVSLTNEDLSDLTVKKEDGTSEDVLLSVEDDRKTVTIKPAGGCFDGNSDYTVMANGDLFGLTSDLSFSFKTTEVGSVFKILDMGIKNGSETDNFSSGDDVILWIEYLRVGDETERSGVLAYTAEKDLMLMDMKLFSVDFNAFGKQKIEKPVALSAEVFNTINMYIWRKGSYLPIKKGISIR